MRIIALLSTPSHIIKRALANIEAMLPYLKEEKKI